MNAPHALRIETTGVPPTPPVGGVGKRPHVTVRGLSKRFDKAVIYDNFDLDIPRGELISVFGPNGCGKSTLINMIAGLIPVDKGQILFDGMLLSEIKFGYVFQNYREALFPWMRAFDNISYPLKMMKVPPAERKARTEKLVEHLGVKIDLNLYPYQMSGGQQQLVSIMRVAGGRTGNPVSRRAVLRARLRDDAVHARAAAEAVHGKRHYDGAGVARPRRGGVSRRPRAAVVAPSGAASPTSRR